MYKKVSIFVVSLVSERSGGREKKTKHQQLEKVAADTTMVNRGPDRELAQHSTVNNIPGEHIAKKQTGATC